MLWKVQSMSSQNMLGRLPKKKKNVLGLGHKLCQSKFEHSFDEKRHWVL